MPKELTLRRADGSSFAHRCRVAETPYARLRGLLARTGMEPGEALLLRPASSIHTCFMRFAIDAVFLDAEMNVLRIVHDLEPWRAAARRGARSVVELGAGEAARAGLRVGERLSF